VKDKFLNITHADIDGAACSILLRKFYGAENVEIVPIAFSNADKACTQAIEKWSDKYKAVFITDIYPSPEIAAKFDNSNIYMFDHHDSGIPSSKHCTILSNKEYSAALVVASKVNGIKNLTKDMKSLVFLTTDYDSYQLTDERSRQLNLLYFGKYTFDQYVDRFTDGFDGFTNSEKTYIKGVEKQIVQLKKQVPDKMWCWNLGGFKVSACTVYDHMNDITDHMFELEPYTDIALVLRIDKRRGSLRLRPTDKNDIKKDIGFDMQKYVETVIKAQGGGHEFSGGFSWDVKDEFEGIPNFLLDFRKWNAKLGKDNFYNIKVKV